MLHAQEVFAANALPLGCFPNLLIEVEPGKWEENALFIEKHVLEENGEPVLSCFLKLTAEVFLILDHTKGSPQNRLDWLTEMRDFLQIKAKERGLEQISCWVPGLLDPSFGPRLEDLGFIKSPWTCYTFNL